MKIQLFIQILVLLSANIAFALPVVNMKSLEDQESVNCARKPQQESYRDLIHHTSVMGRDDRKSISQNLEVVGFSNKEQEQAMHCTGYVYCPGGRGSAKMQSAGAICGPGQRNARGECAADRLGTVRHLFVDGVTHRSVAQIEKCEFKSYRGHVSKLVVGDITASDPKVDLNNPHKNTRADKVVVRLKSPIPNCDPYDLPDSDAAPEVGTELVALTHPQEDQQGVSDGSEPQAYLCQVTRSFAGRGGGPALFYNDCDLNGVGSGGFALVRNYSTNKLAVAGMFVGAGALSKNGMPYSESTDPAVKNFTLAIGTNADFLQMAAQPGIRPEPQLSQGVLPQLRPTSGR